METIPLPYGYEALIDDEDFEELSRYRWYIFLPSLSVVRAGRIQMSRQIMNAPPDKLVDHRNGNRLDMQRANLRLCTDSQNQQNARKLKGATSKYKGVHFKHNKRVRNNIMRSWQATIGLRDIFGRSFNKSLGYFFTEEAAAKAYDEAARSFFKKFARLNFPEVGEQSCL